MGDDAARCVRKSQLVALLSLGSSSESSSDGCSPKERADRRHEVGKQPRLSAFASAASSSMMEAAVYSAAELWWFPIHAYLPYAAYKLLGI